MTTIVAVKKGGNIAIAADALTTFGDMRLASDYQREYDKLMRLHGSWVGVCGSSAHQLVLQCVFARQPTENVDFSCRVGVYETFRRLHPILKEEFYLNPKEEEDDPYESSQLTAMIANATGIYCVYSYREVFDIERFWAIGSGRNFALGAMHALYDRLDRVEDIARAGVKAGVEFDTASGGPVLVHTIQSES